MNWNEKWNIKRILLFILLLFLHSLLYSQETSAIQSNLSTLEDTLIQLENNSLDQKNIIESLQKDLEASQLTSKNWESLQKETSAELDNALKSLKRQELLCKSWKIVAGVSISVNIIAIGIMSFAIKD